MRTTRLRTLVAVLLLLQLYVVYYSFHHGVLQGPVQMDDTAYLERSLMNLEVLTASQSPYDLMRATLDIRLHAPLAELSTMLGLLVSGGELWAPFALNVLLVLLAAYAIALRTTALSGALFAAILIFLLTQPLTINALTFLKSDWKGGVLMAAAIFALHEAAEQNDRNLKLFGAALLGLAVASKLTAFYLPVFALGILVVFELYGFVARNSHSRSVAHSGVEGAADGRTTFRSWLAGGQRTWALCAALAVMPYAVFFLLGAKGLVYYIREALGSVWYDGLTIGERAASYTPIHPDGAVAWGTLHLSFAIFAVANIVIALWRRDYRHLASLAIVVLLFLVFMAPLAAARTSNITFGGTMIGVVVGGTLIAMCAFARSLPRWGGMIALLVTVVLALATQWPLSSSGYRVQFGKPPGAQLRALQAAYRQIAERLEPSPGMRPSVVAFYNHLFAPPRNLTILHFQQTGDVVRTVNLTNISNLDVVRQQLAMSKFALTLISTPEEPNPPGVVTNPEPVDGRGADELVAQHSDFEFVDRWAIDAGEIRLYRNSAFQPGQK
jgi:hypothetical protein